MRLINIDTNKLEEFFGDAIPPYAILSHRWEEPEELSFEQWQWLETNDGGDVTQVKRKRGYSKIDDACHFVRHLQIGREGQPDLKVQYLWIDTVCIDKRSSAELSEAINSMFDWYKQSAICLVYLYDVTLISPHHELSEATRRQFRESEWFQRGWTLQELLAPQKTLYLSKAWNMIGSQRDLVMDLSYASKVPPDVLDHSRTLDLVPAAEKMFWASKRTTKIKEDISYCLLGIFGVNMPLIYGEGFRAFKRLQLEVIKEHHDHSILLWDGDRKFSALAPSPAVFQKSFRGRIDGLLGVGKTPYFATNAGLQMNLPLIPTLDDTIFLAIVDCKMPSSRNRQQYCLLLFRPWLDPNLAWVLGYLILDMTVFCSMGEQTVAALQQPICLNSTPEPYISRTWSDILAPDAEGKPFMLVFWWTCGSRCVAKFMFITDEYPGTKYEAREWLPPRSQSGFMRLDHTGHSSGLQLMLLAAVDPETEEKDWFAVFYVPQIGWGFHWFGSSPPKKLSREAVAQEILAHQDFSPLTKQDPSRRFLTYQLCASVNLQIPVWPAKFEELGREGGVLLSMNVWPNR